MTRQQPSTEAALQHVGFAAVLGLLGAVCGALTTDAVQKLAHVGPSAQYWNLAGVVVGAVLPLFIGGPGAYWRLRAAVGVAVTTVVVVLAYSGLLVAASVPRLNDVAPDVPPLIATSGKPGIGIAPAGKLTCTHAECAPVIIRSTGSGTLGLDDITIEGPNAKDFTHSGPCAHTTLAPREECAVHIRFAPSGPGDTRTARLVVHHNVAGSRSHLDLAGVPPKPDLSIRGSSCRYLRTSGRDTVQVEVRLVLTGGVLSKPTAGVRARGDTGAVVSYRAPIGMSRFTIAIKPGQKNEISIDVDSANEFAEGSETNNAMRLTTTVPLASPSPGPLKCEFKPT